MSEDTLDNLTENFSLFTDWEDRYRYLIDLGKHVPAMENTLKTEENRIRGCTSKVWMVSGWEQDGTFRFQADSDAQIIRGLIYILYLAYQGRTRVEIAAVDIAGTFTAMGLDQHISPNRRNGFFAMVEKIRTTPGA